MGGVHRSVENFFGHVTFVTFFSIWGGGRVFQKWLIKCLKIVKRDASKIKINARVPLPHSIVTAIAPHKRRSISK